MLGDGANVDRDAALCELILGYSPDDRTLFQQIRIAPAGAIFSIHASGIAVRARSLVRYGDRYGGAGLKAKFRELDEAYERIAARYNDRPASDLVISISAGFDSRYALAYLATETGRPGLCTFGHPDSEEVEGARLRCAAIGRTTDVFDVPEADWSQWIRGIQSLGNCGMTQWSGWAESWLEFLARHGDAVVIGYVGDALTGKHIGQRGDDADPVDFWMRFNDVAWWGSAPILRQEVRAPAGSLVREQVRAAIAEHSFAYPHQNIVHMDLYGRQRRWVAAQPNSLQRRVVPALFFFDEQLIDFWCNVGADDLLGQRLYRQFASERFPRLFPKNEGRAPGVLKRGLRKVLGTLQGVATGESRGQRPRVIDPARIIGPNRAHIVRLARRVRHLAEPIIDVEAFCDAVNRYHGTFGLGASMLIRTVNLCMLLDLCNGVEQSASASSTADEAI
jgi:hypothetical protein